MIEWNCRAPEKAAKTEAAIQTKRGAAVLTHAQKESAITIGGKTVLRVNGVARVVTDADGKVLHVVGDGRGRGECYAALAEWEIENDDARAKCDCAGCGLKATVGLFFAVGFPKCISAKFKYCSQSYSGHVMLAGANVIADCFHDGMIHRRPLIGAERIFVQQFVNRSGGDGA